jgi:hypothetical protein
MVGIVAIQYMAVDDNIRGQLSGLAGEPEIQNASNRPANPAPTVRTGVPT